MSTDAKRAGNARYLAKLKTITVRMQPDTAETIQQAAAAAGESVNGYILAAIDERIQRENHDKPKKHLTKSHLHAKMCIMSDERENASVRGVVTHYTVLTY